MTISFFFFNDPATTEIYTLSLHDALPIPANACRQGRTPLAPSPRRRTAEAGHSRSEEQRLNSSHMSISYAVFCLKKKKKKIRYTIYKKKKKKITNIIFFIIMITFRLFFFFFFF